MKTFWLFWIWQFFLELQREFSPYCRPRFLTSFIFLFCEICPLVRSSDFPCFFGSKWIPNPNQPLRSSYTRQTTRPNCEQYSYQTSGAEYFQWWRWIKLVIVSLPFIWASWSDIWWDVRWFWCFDLLLVCPWFFTLKTRETGVSGRNFRLVTGINFVVTK